LYEYFNIATGLSQAEYALFLNSYEFFALFTSPSNKNPAKLLRTSGGTWLLNEITISPAGEMKREYSYQERSHYKKGNLDTQ